MLLNYYNKTNRVIDTGKTVTYSREKTYGGWTYLAGAAQWITYDQAWKYTRVCTKTYRYVGMDKQTATACAAFIQTYYTRNTLISEWKTDGANAGTFVSISGGQVPMARVTIQNSQNSPMFDVLVQVDEYDEKWSMQALTPSTMFATENAREYDTN